MTRIATYAFLDLETTSIPLLDGNSTRITELCMLAVRRRHILETRAGVLPRVQHKLTMCINPAKMIDPGATDTSGLDNDLLEHETTFNMNVFNTINSFLECQEKPVCLISENGYSFDFPIIKSRFEKLNVCLSEDVMCADSLYSFFDILTKQKINMTASCDHQDTRSPSDIVPCEVNLAKGITKTEAIIIDDDDIKTQVKDKQNNNSEASPFSMQQQNEMTPQKRKLIPVKHIRQVKRKIFFEGHKKPEDSFRLSDIYERVFGRPAVDAHRAENDCIMAAEIATVHAKLFVQWVDDNHCAFSEVKAMTPGVKCGAV